MPTKDTGAILTILKKELTTTLTLLGCPRIIGATLRFLYNYALLSRSVHSLTAYIFGRRTSKSKHQAGRVSRHPHSALLLRRKKCNFRVHSMACWDFIRGLASRLFEQNPLDFASAAPTMQCKAAKNSCAPVAHHFYGAQVFGRSDPWSPLNCPSIL